MGIIEDEIVELRRDYPKLSHVKDEHVFSLVCMRYFYSNGEFNYSDYHSSFTDAGDDGGIDLITIDQKNGQDQLVLIQSKYISELSNSQDFVDVFTKMSQTVDDFKNERIGGYNKVLRRIYRERFDSIDNQPPYISLILFTTYSPTPKLRTQIDNELGNIESLESFDPIIYYKDDIESQILKIISPKQYVEEDKVIIAKEDGHITYKENGLLVNVSANSLKRLFDLYKDGGLFEQNFRYFIKNKKIDDRINQSLVHKRDMFWFLNNGIIIGCKDYLLDGDNVKLFDFSIINGCQTVSLIGKYTGSNQGEDFYLPCKIVKPSNKDNFNDFIGDIAEASNSQKPISEKDLKSNRPEQKRLQDLLKKDEPRIYLYIKRGEELVSSAGKKSLEPWQIISNEKYGQMMLAFIFQKPGTARSGKKYIFSNTGLYDMVFKRQVNKATIVDTLKLFGFFEKWVNNQAKDDLFTGPDHMNIGTNGTFIVPSIIGFMIKEKRKLIDTRKINDGDVEWEREISKDSLGDKPLFVENLPDDYQDTLNDLFSDICAELLGLYNSRVDSEKTVSNFFKSDIKYQKVILEYVVNMYYRQKRGQSKLNEFLKIFEK